MLTAISRPSPSRWRCFPGACGLAPIGGIHRWHGDGGRTTTQPADLETVASTEAGWVYAEVPVQNFGTSRDVMMRLPAQGGQSTAQQSETVMAALEGREPLAVTPPAPVRRPQVARSWSRTAEALGHGGRRYHGYLVVRFEWKYVVAAIIANLARRGDHAWISSPSSSGNSLAVLAAVLAVLGYSVNESVGSLTGSVKSFRCYRKMNTVEIIDHAITSTISRTIITHASTQIMVLADAAVGGPRCITSRWR